MQKAVSLAVLVISLLATIAVWFWNPLGEGSSRLPGPAYIIPNSPWISSLLDDLNAHPGGLAKLTPLQKLRIISKHLATVPANEEDGYRAFFAMRDAYRGAVIESALWRCLYSFPLFLLAGWGVFTFTRKRDRGQQ